MRQSDLISFFSMTFLLTWGIAGVYVFAPDVVVPLFGNLSGTHPLYFLATWAPAISALILVLYRHGLDGVRRYLSRLFLWQASLYWYGFLILLVPLMFYVAAYFKGGEYELFPFASLSTYFTALFFMMIKGPIEEIGWRGLALPLLQRCLAPIWAGLVIGFIWAVWHTPAFLLSVSVYSTWSFLPFFVGTLALSVIMTPLFNSSRGSILLPALLHWQLINPLWPDGQPYDNWLFVVVAVVVVWFNRATMFSRDKASTEVIPE